VRIPTHCSRAASFASGPGRPICVATIDAFPFVFNSLVTTTHDWLVARSIGAILELITIPGSFHARATQEFAEGIAHHMVSS
jgi:hypothetical protein